jgi:hypothetical protein
MNSKFITRSEDPAINADKNSGAVIIGAFASGNHMQIDGDTIITADGGGTGKTLGIQPEEGNVGIGTNSADDSAILELVSTTQGFLMPRMTTAQILAIANPVEALKVYNLDDGYEYFYDRIRAEWLSVNTQTFQWGRNGANDGVNLHYNNMVDGTNGPLMPKDGTIIGITARQDGGNPFKTYQFEVNAANVLAFNLVASVFNDQTVDVDFSANDYLGVFAVSAGFPAADSAIVATTRWRLQ